VIVATLTKVLAGVALLGAAATTVLIVLPHPGSQNGVWLDTPLDKAVVEAGEIPIVLHSDLPGITAIYVDVVLDGTTTVTLRDTDLERVARGAGAEQLSVFDQEWSVDEPGVYTLKVSVSGSTDVKRSFTVEVLEQGGVSVDIAEGVSQPSASPTPTPTPEPTLTAEPEGPSGPLVAGDVVRFQSGDDDWLSQFYLNAYSPAEATTVLEIRITDTINGVTGDWQRYPCTNVTNHFGVGDNARYNCVVSDHLLSPPS
jgi:hypothetical protein